MSKIQWIIRNLKAQIGGTLISKRRFVGYFILIFFLSFFTHYQCNKSGPNGLKQHNKVKDPISQDELPNIVPYLDSNPSKLDGQGVATITPVGPFKVGSMVDFKIQFKVGESGISPNGFLILQISPWWGWTHPQNTVPNANGFISVKPSFRNPQLKVKVLSMHRVLIFSPHQPINAGETIVINYLNAIVDKFAETNELFMIFVDGDGDGHSACIANPPRIETYADDPIRLNAAAPSLTKPGDSIFITITPLDVLNNWSKFPSGHISMSIIFDGKEINTHKKECQGFERKMKFSYTPLSEGIYFFIVKGPGRILGKSNVMFCQNGNPRYQLFFGDIHGHSRFSDGTGTPKEFYRYARDVSGLDIASLTDHADYGLIPIQGKTWRRIIDVTNRFYTPGKFVTFIGFEWTNWEYGHRNVYYKGKGGPIFRSIDKKNKTPEKLWQQLSSYDAMTIAHHVGGGPVPIDWSVPPGKKEKLVEICSIHGSSEYYGCESGIYRPQEGHFIQDALSLGYQLGIMASGDTHDGHPGQRSFNAFSSGLMGVYATELTRESVWDALQKRRVYGTSGPKIILNFRVGDSPMGSYLRWPASKGPLPIAVRVIGCEDIAKIEIIRNGETIFTESEEKINGVFALLLIEDPNPIKNTAWYYARIVQKDKNMAWSSPVWVSIIKSL